MAIILVTHYNKNSMVESIQRVGGAMGMVGAVRIAWSFAEEKECGTRKMLPLKANIGKDMGGLEYTIEGKDQEIDGQLVNVGYIQFGKVTHASIDEALKDGGKPTKIGAAMAWLSDFMSDGEPRIASEVINAGNLAGHVDYIIQNAYKKLNGLKPLKSAGPNGGWVWVITKKVGD